MSIHQPLTSPLHKSFIKSACILCVACLLTALLSGCGKKNADTANHGDPLLAGLSEQTDIVIGLDLADFFQSQAVNDFYRIFNEEHSTRQTTEEPLAAMRRHLGLTAEDLGQMLIALPAREDGQAAPGAVLALDLGRPVTTDQLLAYVQDAQGLERLGEARQETLDNGFLLTWRHVSQATDVAIGLNGVELGQYIYAGRSDRVRDALHKRGGHWTPALLRAHQQASEQEATAWMSLRPTSQLRQQIFFGMASQGRRTEEEIEHIRSLVDAVQENCLTVKLEESVHFRLWISFVSEEAANEVAQNLQQTFAALGSRPEPATPMMPTFNTIWQTAQVGVTGREMEATARLSPTELNRLESILAMVLAPILNPATGEGFME